MAAHRHWRVLILTGNNGQFTGFSELEFKAIAGGADLTGSGTASSSSVQSGSAAAVFDNNTTTTQIQFTGTGQGSWVAYDFGVGVAHDIIEVVMHPNKDDATRTPKDWSLQYSDNGTTWVDSGLLGYKVIWLAGVSVTFTKPTSPNQLRSRIRWGTSVGGGSASCVEMEMRETVGGPDITAGLTYVANTTFFGFVASRAFDDDPSSLWSGNNGILPAEWISCVFNTPKTIREVVFTARTGSDGINQSPTSGWLEVSPDGTSWGTVAAFTTTPWVGGDTKTLISIASAPLTSVVKYVVLRYRKVV